MTMNKNKEHIRIRVSADTHTRVYFYKQFNQITLRDIYLKALEWIMQTQNKETCPAPNPKELKSIRFELEKGKANWLRDYCRTHGLNSSRLLERALQEVLTYNDIKQGEVKDDI